jgi:hypothetical protein
MDQELHLALQQLVLITQRPDLGGLFRVQTKQLFQLRLHVPVAL